MLFLPLLMPPVPHSTQSEGETVDTSDKGLALIKSFEGCYLEAYLCPAGKWTIGFGHTDGVHKGMSITTEEADRLLIRDVVWAEDVVDRHVPKSVPLSQHQFDALVSWVFNLGEGNFAKSTLLKEIKRNRLDTVPAQILRWNKHEDPSTKRRVISKGLVRRRHAEAALWNEVAVPLPDVAEPMPQAVCPSTPPASVLAQSKTIWASGLGGAATFGTWMLGTAAEASKQTAESLSATSALRDALGMSGGSIAMMIALTCAGVAIFARLSAHFGGKIG
jgi:lysozyme